MAGGCHFWTQITIPFSSHDFILSGSLLTISAVWLNLNKYKLVSSFFFFFCTTTWNKNDTTILYTTIKHNSSGNNKGKSSISSQQMHLRLDAKSWRTWNWKACWKTRFCLHRWSNYPCHSQTVTTDSTHDCQTAVTVDSIHCKNVTTDSTHHQTFTTHCQTAVIIDSEHCQLSCAC